jgi:hypothetical protein
MSFDPFHDALARSVQASEIWLGLHIKKDSSVSKTKKTFIKRLAPPQQLKTYLGNVSTGQHSVVTQRGGDILKTT